MIKGKNVFILVTLILILIFNSSYGKSSEDSALEKVIETEITRKYSITGNDKLEKYYEDFDNDGKEEVLVILVKKDKNDSYDKINSYSSFFIFKPAGSLYKLVFHKDLPKGYINYQLRGDSAPPKVVKIVKTSEKVFFAFNIMTRPGANGYNWKFLVYTYDKKGQKYKQVYASKEKISLGETRPFELLTREGNVCISMFYIAGGTSVCPKVSKSYFYWDGSSFKYSHDENQ